MHFSLNCEKQTCFPDFIVIASTLHWNMVNDARLQAMCMKSGLLDMIACSHVYIWIKYQMCTLSLDYSPIWAHVEMCIAFRENSNDHFIYSF